MFNEGREPQLIKYNDYVRWKKSVVRNLKAINSWFLLVFLKILKTKNTIINK